MQETGKRLLLIIKVRRQCLKTAVLSADFKANQNKTLTSKPASVTYAIKGQLVGTPCPEAWLPHPCEGASLKP